MVLQSLLLVQKFYLCSMKEAIITIVGFLGAGKTTLLNYLINAYLEKDWHPFVILNDYENAYLDMQQLSTKIDSDFLKPLTGSCICCSGIGELRNFVNNIPERDKGITLIEANGTSDATALMGFLGVGLAERFLPPIQVSVVDVKNWQKREFHNELEAKQIQVSSLIILSQCENVSKERIDFVKRDVKKFNPYADVITKDEMDIALLPKLSPSQNEAEKLAHHKSHWASCSVDMPKIPDEDCIYSICEALPSSILRIKGCVQIENQEGYTYFDRLPNGKINVRPFNGEPSTGAKLLTIGPGSDLSLLEKAVNQSLSKAKVL